MPGNGWSRDWPIWWWENESYSKKRLLKPLSYEELGLLSDERPEKLGEISLVDLKEGDIPQRPIGIKREKMGVLPREEHIWCTYFLMVDRKTSRAVGSIGFKGVPVDDAVEVGYGIAEVYRGRGYMGEALSGLLDWAAGTGLCHKVVADTHVGNIASQSVLMKCGFTRVGESGAMVHFKKTL